MERFNQFILTMRKREAIVKNQFSEQRSNHMTQLWKPRNVREKLESQKVEDENFLKQSIYINVVDISGGTVIS